MKTEIDLREMLEAGVHFGHKKDRWNPKMKPYIYTERNGVHIFDLTITKKKLEEAMEIVSKITKDHGTVLFVGTKNQIKDIVKEAAEKVEMPYLVNRWPGGMLTNFQTIVKMLKHLDESEERVGTENSSLTKKERLSLQRELTKLKATFGGVQKLRKLPDLIFVSDICKERIAIREAKKVGIPVIGIADSNATPDIEFVIPGNDDAVKSVKYIVESIAGSINSPNKDIELEEIAISSKEKEEPKKAKK